MANSELSERLDQTNFGYEKPIFENEPRIVDPHAVVAPPAPPQPWYKRPLVLVGIAGGSLLFLILILILVYMPKPQLPINSITPFQPTQTDTQPSEFETRLDQASQDLEAADPTRPTLPFPVVNLDLQLENVTE
ncbi:MAG TPA: hypothetical protein VD999_05075 [Vitreimonas sp.]|nr:hypothetical protein [Vitreimonas sp.]